MRKQISSVLYRAVSFEDFSDRLMQQYGITVKESRGQLSYLPAGRTKFIRARHLGDKFDKAAVLATLQANAERKPKAQFKQDTIGKLIDIQSKMTEGKGIGYKRWAHETQPQSYGTDRESSAGKGLDRRGRSEPAHR